MARDWFLKANERDELYPVSGITREVFRKSPAQALFDYASAITEEGQFDEAQRRWEEANDEWLNVFGNEIFLGLEDVKYKMNCTEDELEEMARQNEVPLNVQRATWDRRTKMINYECWKKLSECERDPVTIAARKAIYKGKQAHWNGDISDRIDDNGELQISPAQADFETGIQKTAELFELYPDVQHFDDKILDALLAVYYWSDIHKHNGKEPDLNHPLAEYVKEHRHYFAEVIQMFQRETTN